MHTIFPATWKPNSTAPSRNPDCLPHQRPLPLLHTCPTWLLFRVPLPAPSSCTFLPRPTDLHPCSSLWTITSLVSAHLSCISADWNSCSIPTDVIHRNRSLRRSLIKFITLSSCFQTGSFPQRFLSFNSTTMSLFLQVNSWACSSHTLLS